MSCWSWVLMQVFMGSSLDRRAHKPTTATLTFLKDLRANKTGSNFFTHFNVILRLGCFVTGLEHMQPMMD
jgi:hypothetical protein